MGNILKVTRLNHSGMGIASDNNLVTFIPKTIPGDVVEVKVVKKHKNFQEARVVNYVERSQDWIESFCPYYYACGGCQISNFSYLKQLEYKRNKVVEILDKFCGIRRKIDIIFCNQEYGYRNKITLQINDGLVGLYEEKTNSLVEICECKLVDKQINSIIKKLVELDLVGVKKVVVRKSYREMMLVVEEDGRLEVGKFVSCFKNVVKTIIINKKVVWGEGFIVEKLDDLFFIISPESFFQVNSNQVSRLYEKVLEYANPSINDRVIDLYCGTGTIGIYLASHCRHVLGIEINESAIRDANKNKQLNSIDNIDFICGDVGRVIKDGYEADIVIVDPPRSGLDKKAREGLLKIFPQKIVYVSCNPVTLARDLNVLLEKYEVVDMILVDMFPQTYHVESVVLLTWKK